MVGPAHDHHRHRDLQAGTARAAVFGVSDGLVSNLALVVGVIGADVGRSTVLVTGLAGLVAGAISMAAGEWVSVTAQNELIERELRIERISLDEEPEHERDELVELYEQRGLSAATAREVADVLMADPEVALATHAREELGIDPDRLGSPVGAAGSSFVAFSLGAFAPLVPWFFTEGRTGLIATLVIGIVCAILVGGGLGQLAGNSVRRAALRHVAIVIVGSAATYAIGALVGSAV